MAEAAEIGSGVRRGEALRSRVMAFVRGYMTDRPGESPSLGEIADHVRSTRPNILRVLDRLERDGQLRRLAAGPRRKRGIVLPDQQAGAVAMLRALGWTVNPEVRSITPPASARCETDGELPVHELLRQIDQAAAVRATGERRHGEAGGEGDT